MAVKIGSLFGTVSLDTRQLDKDIKKVGAKMRAMGKSIQGLGKVMSATVTAPVLAMGTASAKTFANFESAMKKVEAISGATVKELDDLTESAKELGAETIFTSSQVAELQLNLSKLGFAPEEILNSTKAILQLAQATDEDLAESATVVAGVLRAFAIDARDTQRVTDVMAKSFSSSALDLEKFSTAMATVAPIAAQFGMDIEGTTAMLATLVNRNMDASVAGTSLRNIFLELSTTGMTLDEAYDQITQSTEQAATAFDLFGKRGAAAAVILANNAAETYKLFQQLGFATGSAEAMSNIMMQGLLPAFKIFMSRVESVAISIGERLSPHLIGLLNHFGELLVKFNELNPAQQDNIIQFALLAAAIGPLLIGLGGLLIALGLLIPVLGTIITFFSAISSITYMVIAGVTLFTTGLILLMKQAHAAGVAIGEFLYKHFEGLALIILKVADYFKSKLLGAFRSVTNYIKGVMNRAIDSLFNNLKGLLNFFNSVVGKVGNFVVNRGTGIQARAEGGSVQSGQTYLVGEQGAELFTPSRSGYIVPNDEMSGSSITMNFAAGTDMNTVAALKKMKNEIGSIAVQAIRDYNMRTA